MDMQGFAINVRLLLKRDGVWFEGGGDYTDMGYIEASRFIYQFVTNTSLLECRTQMNEVDISHKYSISPDKYVRIIIIDMYNCREHFEMGIHILVHIA